MKCSTSSSQGLAESTAKERPKTAKAVRSAMSGRGLKHGTMNKGLLDARRALANKLKKEIQQIE